MVFKWVPQRPSPPPTVLCQWKWSLIDIFWLVLTGVMTGGALVLIFSICGAVQYYRHQWLLPTGLAGQRLEWSGNGKSYVLHLPDGNGVPYLFQNGDVHCGTYSTRVVPKDGLPTLVYAEGSMCPNRERRGARVEFKCGPKLALTKVEEPDMCKYVATVETPYVCGASPKMEPSKPTGAKPVHVVSSMDTPPDKPHPAVAAMLGQVCNARLDVIKHGGYDLYIHRDSHIAGLWLSNEYFGRLYLSTKESSSGRIPIKCGDHGWWSWSLAIVPGPKLELLGVEEDRLCHKLATVAVPDLPLTGAEALTNGQIPRGGPGQELKGVLTGTTGQLTVTNSAGTITLTTPQDVRSPPRTPTVKDLVRALPSTKEVIYVFSPPDGKYYLMVHGTGAFLTKQNGWSAGFLEFEPELAKVSLPGTRCDGNVRHTWSLRLVDGPKLEFVALTTILCHTEATVAVPPAPGNGPVDGRTLSGLSIDVLTTAPPIMATQVLQRKELRKLLELNKDGVQYVLALPINGWVGHLWQRSGKAEFKCGTFHGSNGSTLVYEGGDKCDGGKPRSATIQFVHGPALRLASVTEPTTCHYVATVEIPA